MEKKVLVSVGENTRIVTLSTGPASNVADSMAVADLDALAQAVCVAFAYGMPNPPKIDFDYVKR